MKTNAEEIVKLYFALIKDLRSGKEGSVERLTELWQPDGTFQFVGSPEVNATFQGINAINVLYKNRFKANGMPVKLEGAKPLGADATAALGVVDTEVVKTAMVDDKIVASWKTSVGTNKRFGFVVGGSHTFRFHDGKISSLKVSISPKAEGTPNLDIGALSVKDVGRLSLAAWAVV